MTAKARLGLVRVDPERLRPCRDWPDVGGLLCVSTGERQRQLCPLLHRRPLAPNGRTGWGRVEAVLQAPARIDPAVCANRLGGVIIGGSTCIRERARELGLSLTELAGLVGLPAAA